MCNFYIYHVVFFFVGYKVCIGVYVLIKVYVVYTRLRLLYICNFN